MAQPNVVREPSMDEILASIRRIIESNDPVPPMGLATGMAEPEGFSGSAANDDSEDVPLTVDDTFAPHAETFRPALNEGYATARVAEPIFEAPQRFEDQLGAQPQKSLSLADVAARVRAASERNPGLRDLAPRAPEPMEAATSPLMTGRMADLGATAAPVFTEAAPVVREPVRMEPVFAEPVAAAAPTLAPEPIQTPAMMDEPMDVAVELEAEVEQQVVQDEAPASPLLSAGTGQQVARSFQDLAFAVNEAERRSFDDIASDLLRPMLQEWLDDNLPTLVERLVREEIERVARGARR